MNTLGFASLAAVQQYIRYAQQVGLDVHAALTSTGIEPTILDARQGRMRGERFQALIEQLMLQAEDPLFGLHTSQQVQSSSYDLIGVMSLNCATLGDAVGLTVPFERLVGDMGITIIQQRYAQVEQTWHPAYSLSHVRTQMIDNVLASWTQYARWLVQQRVSPLCVQLERRRPAERFVKEYEAFYGCKVLFEQAANTLIYPQALMELSLAQHGDARLSTITEQARKQMQQFDDPQQRLSVRTQNIIRRQLQFGQVQKLLVARELNMSERTLQRKLTAEGHSYQQLLDQVREECALEMLHDASCAMEEIAHNLGFAELRCFRRRFKVWTGQTPADYRRELRR